MITFAALSMFLLLAQQPQHPEPLSLVYDSGETCTARVLGLEKGEARLEVELLGGHLEVTRRLGDFTPASAFAIEKAAHPPHDYDSHFALAERAAGLGLIGEAGTEARAALDALPVSSAADDRREAVREWGAKTLLRLFDRAIASRHAEEARHCLTLLSTRMSDRLTDEELEGMVVRLEELESRPTAVADAALHAKDDARERERIEQHLGPIRKKVAAGDELLKEAVRKSRSTVAATRACERAVDTFQKAFDQLGALTHEHPDDAELERTAERLGKHLHDATIRADLFAANMLTVQSDYRGAAGWANRVLLLEPDNKEAHEMLRTIEVAQAAASGIWRWGWGWGTPQAARGF
ncbi:MAG: hypothetical protein H6835_04860 [Planctomycetes bacterium]|nr:hypothetical protein [Planctomycetota bacterium]